jgi:hypothetical protein
MIAHHFVLTRLDTGARIGHAVLCPEGRYAAILWHDVERIDRHFTTLAMWRSIAADLWLSWEHGLVESRCAVHRLLVRDESRDVLTLQWIAQLQIDGHPPAAMEAFDAFLRKQEF